MTHPSLEGWKIGKRRRSVLHVKAAESNIARGIPIAKGNSQLRCKNSEELIGHRSQQKRFIARRSTCDRQENRFGYDVGLRDLQPTSRGTPFLICGVLIPIRILSGAFGSKTPLLNLYFAAFLWFCVALSVTILYTLLVHLLYIFTMTVSDYFRCLMDTEAKTRKR